MCSMLHPSSHKHQNCYIESSGGLPTHSPSRLRWKAKRVNKVIIGSKPSHLLLI